MKYNFTKMQGLGNDFVVFDAIHQQINLTSSQIQWIADRHFGIGCDQLLLVEEYKGQEADFRYRIFNADGSEVEQCGNGARCFARFVYDNKLTNKTEIPVMTAGGKIILKIQKNNQVTVDMGIPIFSPQKIPLQTKKQQKEYQLEINQQQISFGAVSMGNPHAVLIVDNVKTAPVSKLGKLLESHPFFPQRVNVGFMQICHKNAINLRVFERGVGETLACGTGACAAVVIGRLHNALAETVQVNLSGGSLSINWQGEGTSVLMTGDATTVFTGSINL